MLVNRVLVILIELHQPTDTRERRHQLLQQMRTMHRLKGFGRTRSSQDRQERASGLRRMKPLDGEVSACR